MFARAVDAIRDWNVQRGAGLIVLSEGPPAPGVMVAIAAPLPIGYIDVVCRVVDIVDTDDRYGFAYGTLPVHPERGEESFTVVRDADGSVKFEIVAVWRSKHPLARAFPFIARMLQCKATNRYLDAMRAGASQNYCATT